jgi:hypothetical protein
MLFPLTQYELKKSPRPPVSSLVNLVVAEALSSMPWFRQKLMNAAIRANQITIDIVERLRVAEMFETMKVDAAEIITKRKEPITGEGVAVEVEVMLYTPPECVSLPVSEALH